MQTSIYIHLRVEQTNLITPVSSAGVRHIFIGISRLIAYNITWLDVFIQNGHSDSAPFLGSSVITYSGCVVDTQSSVLWIQVHRYPWCVVHFLDKVYIYDKYADGLLRFIPFFRCYEIDFLGYIYRYFQGYLTGTSGDIGSVPLK